MRTILTILAVLIALYSCKNNTTNNISAQNSNEVNSAVRFKHDSEKKMVSVYFGESLFTNYLYVEDYYKPVLHPLLTKSGKSLTRGYPINPQPNERVDHPHHVGYWLNYGDVNGLDFWNHSDAIPAEKKRGIWNYFSGFL